MAKVIPDVLTNTLRGRIGDLVFMGTPTGTAVYAYKKPRPSNTDGQQNARQRMAFANGLYGQLNAAERLAWDVYARTQQGGAAKGQSAFLSLAMKFLHVNNAAQSVPVQPPGTAYAGETATVTAVSLAPHEVTWTADSSLRGVSRAELLWQPTGSEHCAAPERRFRTVEFVEFGPGALSVTVRSPLCGWHAAAVRFVCVATGQATAVRPVGRVDVPYP